MTHLLLESDAPHDPLALFAAWFDAARPQAIGEPTAMTLATADAAGRPSARIVLLKEYGADGFVFFTNYDSRKSAELAANPYAALLFWWPSAGRQVRVEGRVERVSAAESDTYFATRPRRSKLGAWASDQSRILADRKTLDDRFTHFEQEFPDTVPRPPHWGGYRVVPEAIEFWQNHPDRLHDRLRYRRSGKTWLKERLNP
ncbi:MAG TPA: pyridoxamine 5'-phosphate oxidase [Gammaproteobacteria bacterium]